MGQIVLISVRMKSGVAYLTTIQYAVKKHGLLIHEGANYESSSTAAYTVLIIRISTHMYSGAYMVALYRCLPFVLLLQSGIRTLTTFFRYPIHLIEHYYSPRAKAF